MSYQAEYIWIDGTEPTRKLRSKTKIVADGYQGRAKMIVDQDRRVIIGATLVGQDVGELIHAFTIAVVGEVPLERLWHAVPSFPTMSEIWLRLLESYGL